MGGNLHLSRSTLMLAGLSKWEGWIQQLPKPTDIRRPNVCLPRRVP